MSAGHRPIPPGSAPPLLVGRERERGVLHEQLDAALTGQGSLVLISGEAGIGKTALAETLCREATRKGVLVFRGCCYDLSETPPYGPWVEVFGRYQPEDDLPFPPAPFAQRGTIGAVSSQSALLQQVLDFFTVLSAIRPLVLLLDDLHWADPASLDLLRFLARNLPSRALLLLATYRTDELTRRHPLSQLLPTLVREANATRLAMHPLAAEAMAALVRGRFPLPDADTSRLVGYLQARGEGNPFFISELLQTLTEERVLREDDGVWTLGDLTVAQVPPLLRQVIDGRLARLDEEVQRLLAVAAIIGQEVPLALWTAVAACDEETLLTAVEQAADAQLILVSRDGMSIHFVHALIREALYEGILPPRRRTWHQRTGEALAALPNPDPDGVAHHFQRAKDERALPWLLEAGERAQVAYAWVTAAARFEAALPLLARQGADAETRGWLLIRLSRLLQFGDVAKARIFADEAVTVADAADDPALAAVAHRQRGLLSCFAGDVVGGVPDMETAADVMATLSETQRAHYGGHVPGIGSGVLVPDGRGTVVMWRAYIGPFPHVRALGERCLAEWGDDESVRQEVRDAQFGLGYTYAALGRPDAAAMFARARDAYLRIGHPTPAAIASWLELELVALPYRTEDIAGRRRLAERAEREHGLAGGVVSTTIPPRFMCVPLLELEGDWAQAERLAALVSGEARGLMHYRMMALRHLATLARLRGDDERARWAVHACLPAGNATGPGQAWPFDVITAVQRVAAGLALDAGELQDAEAWLSAHDHWLAWNGAVLGQAEGHVLWGYCRRLAGDADQAHEHANRALACATAPRQPLALLAAHRLLGELDCDARRFDRASEHLAAALALADACAAPFERARTLLAQAELRAATDERREAGALLAAVRTIGESLGALPTLARTDALAVRLAATPIGGRAYPAGLSAREVEVLRLVAAGKTNREIADTLFVSLGTVNNHLVHILTKTDTANRAEATAFALRHGLA